MKNLYGIRGGTSSHEVTSSDQERDLEALAEELTREALSTLPPDTPADLRSFLETVVLTDLLFDPAYADLLEAELVTRRHQHQESGTVSKEPHLGERVLAKAAAGRRTEGK